MLVPLDDVVVDDGLELELGFLQKVLGTGVLGGGDDFFPGAFLN